MTHIYTDKELNYLNKYPNVYSVAPDFAKRNGYSVVVSSPDPNPALDALKEVNEITQKNKISIENLAFEVNKFKV